ncbi:MAG TPA: DUF885 domain-containing protein [Candidatus Limnocylindrales bacterium]|nr:DUF885 domain-containing protein [Candidatus Limnocylindrales bacterium]
MTVDFVNLGADNRPEPRTAFDHALHKLLDDWFAAEPTWATAVGFHAFDDRWPDPSDAGRTGRLAMLRHHRARLQALSDNELSPSERLDRGIVLDAIDGAEFADAELRDGACDPLFYVYQAGAGLFNILARDYAPWRHRGSAFLGRVERLTDFLSAASEALTGLPNRPVSELHLKTALEQLDGISELVDQGAAEAKEHSAEEPEIARALAEQAPRAKQAVEEFARRLREEIAPRATGEGRLGGELFGQKLRHTLSSELTYTDLQQQAREDYAKVRTEILRLAREAWGEWLPGQAMPTDDQEMIRAVLDAIARVHRQPEELIDWCREEVHRIEDFCRQNNVIGLPDDPLQITWTPVFMRAYGRAFLESPGVLDKGLSSYFWITPPDEALGPEAVESYLREDNDRMLKLLCIHEGVPGHYLQLSWSNRTPSLARAVFQNGMFAEGWAVYVTQVLMDLGYGDHEPALMLTHWKFYLRAVINTLIDIGIHTGDMTEDEAIDLMVNGGFQEEDEARAKWLRARLTSTQLCTYYTGSLEMWNMEIEARRRAATGAGESPDTLPQQRIVGGLGDTPGFDYRSHLESVISHGSPPIKWVSRILFD